MSPEEQSNFEASLRQRKPEPVRSGFFSEIAGELARLERHQRRQKVVSFASLVGLGVAALLLLGMGISLWSGVWSPLPQTSPVASIQAEADPVSTAPEEPRMRAENTLERRIDEGLVFMANGTAARQYRYQFLDRVVWKNPEDGSVMEVEVPREEVFLVPVQTF
jgi:hypothetical protein